MARIHVWYTAMESEPHRRRGLVIKRGGSVVERNKRPAVPSITDDDRVGRPPGRAFYHRPGFVVSKPLKQQLNRPRLECCCPNAL